MSPATSRPGLAAWLGNAVIVFLLVVAALLLARLHGGPWWPASPPPGRLGWAAAIALLYLAACTLPLWRQRTRSHLADAGADAVLVAWASQTGFAAALAERSATALREGGTAVLLRPLDQVDAACLGRVKRALFIASTTGEGDPPDHALRFLQDTARSGSLEHLDYALLALGDRQYASFCAFGRQLDQWLAARGAHALFDRIEVDNADQDALRRWQYELERLGASSRQSDWTPPAYQPWRLQARRLLNPGSQGGPAWDLALVPVQGTLPDWLPGDIAEIGPRNDPAEVQALLKALGLDGDQPLPGGQTLAQRLARSRLPAAGTVRGRAPAEWVDQLAPLPHREYSIASIPSEGQLRLLVREMQDEYGRPGLGSGWLCRHARPGEAIDLRIRANPGFHPPAGDAPLVLVGNGTGLAGLRAHLYRRIQAGQYRNWLLFGERNRAHDLFHGQELQDWHSRGWLPRLDLAFSRDGQRSYVQDLLRARADALREWIEDGASILVCGNASGMAPGVDAALGEILGVEGRERLRSQGRYRRDVY